MREAEVRRESGRDCGAMDIITTQGLTKAYGATRVVDGLDLRVPQGLSLIHI